jgi:GNAT superfamily N-acetyltransferase
MTTLDLAAGADAVPAAVTIRRARECDRAALARMFARCTVQTRYHRFHGFVNALPARYLAEALAGGADHLALVAAVADDADAGNADADADDADDAGDGDADRSIVALASCRTVTAGAAEIGVLVEDRWQRLGLGAALLREIAGHARRHAIGVLTARLLAEQAWILRVLGAYGRCESVASQGVLEVAVRLRPPGPRFDGPRPGWLGQAR